jgi:hypothetical protein
MTIINNRRAAAPTLPFTMMFYTPGMTKLDSETLYVQLGQLVATAPNLKTPGEYPPDTLMWPARASALVSMLGNTLEKVKLEVASDSAAQRDDFRDRYAAEITNVLYRALAVAELSAPADVQGAFLPAGSPLAAFAAVGKILKGATNDVLIVDPYMDEKAVTDFAVLAPIKGVTVRLLADGDKKARQPSLIPALQRWRGEHRGRPLEARLTPPRALHDRLIIVDGTIVYTVSQSLNAIATRSPAIILRVYDPEIAALKISAYEDFWDSSTPLTSQAIAPSR